MASLWMCNSLNTSGYLGYCTGSFFFGEKQKKQKNTHNPFPDPALLLCAKFWRKMLASIQVSNFTLAKTLWKTLVIKICVRRVSVI